MKTTYIVGIVVACVLIAAVSIHALVMHVMRKKKRTEILEHCTTVAKDTVFVSLVSYNDAYGAGQTLHSLFKEAQCPLRVYVGLCELYDDDVDAIRVTATDVYKNLTQHSSAPFCLTDNIRVLRVPIREAHGLFAAREHIERYLYRSERFVMTLDCPAVVSSCWDTYCIKALTTLKRPYAILTTQLQAQLKTQTDIAAESALKSPGTYIAVSGTQIALVRRRPFVLPVFNAFQIKTHTFASIDDHAILLPSIAWSASFSFSNGSRVDAVPFPRLSSWDLDAFQDVIVTSKLLAAKWELYCFTACIGYRIGPIIGTYLNVGIDAVPFIPQYLTDAFTPSIVSAMGVTKGGVSARARLGLSASPSPTELRGKVGSTTAYLSLLARIDLTARSTNENDNDDN